MYPRIKAHPKEHQDESQSSLSAIPQTLESKNSRTVWKSGSMLVFKSVDGSWLEYSINDNSITHKYEQISQQDDEVLLFDKERNFFIKPTSDHIYFGMYATTCDRKFNDGNWVEFTGWKVLRQDVFFQQKDKKVWEKFVNGIKEEAPYIWVSSEGDQIFLRRDDIYFKLNSKNLSVRSPLHDYYTFICHGNWSSLNIIRL